MKLDYDIETMPMQQIASRIHTLTIGLRKFWRSAEGWAPLEAADLLTKARLDWQVSLSACLQDAIVEPSGVTRDGKQILANVILGSLLEGSLKLFLSVWYDSYKNSINAVIRRGRLHDPEVLQLESLRQFFKKEVWLEGDTWDEWVYHVQQRRNAIHSFKDRNIGTHDEFLYNVRVYLMILRYLNGRMPYPDDFYGPLEV